MRRHRAAGWSRAGVALLAVTVLALWLSGIAMHASAADDSLLDLPEWQARWRHAATVLHGVLAWVLCLTAGRWIWPHACLLWHKRGYTARWWLGLMTAASGAFIALGGLFLLYGSVPLRDAMGLLHWWMGLAWPVALAVHAGGRS